MKKSLFGLIVITTFLGTCNKKDTSLCNPTYDPCKFVAISDEVVEVEKYLSNKGITDAIKHCSGMYYKIEVTGESGPKPDICSIIFFKYKGELTNGTVFDESTNSAIEFVLGNLITGFKNSIPLVSAGAKIRLFVPPSLGYGSKETEKIPSNSILIFEVELIAVR